jgi:putative heme-binding domain-containing protein
MTLGALTRASLLFLAWAPLSAGAQGGNPYEADPVAIRAGGALFANRCADCHGADAKGSRGPDLTLLWANGANDARVFDSVRNGVEGSIMPPSLATDVEIWATVAYLRSISTVPPFENNGGDIAHGRRLFADNCARCHRAAGSGGTLGPDLSRIALIRSREALLRAIREPSASVASGYRAVTLTTKSGRTIQGVAKSEDAFSVQIIDTDERMQGYLKADFDQLVREQESLMPQLWPAKIDDRGLDDLLAYLGTLRSTGPGEL